MRLRSWFLSGCLLVALAGVLAAQGAYNDRTDIYTFINGFKLGAERLSGMSRTSATAIQVGGSDVAKVSVTGSVGTFGPVPTAETIGAGGTITANACGGIKHITAAGAVTTDTTNTISDPTAVAGCAMLVCNVGANTITLDKNALILLQGGANVALLANSCLGVISDGTVWRQSSAQQTST